MRLLLIEDDERLAEKTRQILRAATYAVDLALTGEEGREKALGEEYDLLLIDWMLPDISGLTLIKQLKDDGLKLPILMLTARSLPTDTVSGLDAGADDYVTKPYDPDILLARIRTALRHQVPEPLPKQIVCGAISVDQAAHQVKVKQKQVPLTPKEYALLEYLAIHKNRAVPRVELLTHVWDENVDLFSNLVDVNITYLRKKIAPYHKQIQTVKGVGYRLCDA